VITNLFTPELVLEDLRAATRDDALATLADHVALNADGVDGAELLRTLERREAQSSTALGEGVAIPHARIAGLKRTILLFARSSAGIEWESPDRRPVHLVLMLAGPAEDPGGYLKTLAAVSRLMRDARCRARLMAAATADELLRILREDAGKSAAGA
jgi:mannitol/fructose-specific phosphotransferase system IIA component (Ntr-type)